MAVRQDLATSASGWVAVGLGLAIAAVTSLATLVVVGLRSHRAPIAPPADNGKTQELIYELLRQQLQLRQRVLLVQVDRSNPENGVVSVAWLPLDEVKPDFLVVAKDEPDASPAE